jgi:hypothetical protein
MKLENFTTDEDAKKELYYSLLHIFREKIW